MYSRLRNISIVKYPILICGKMHSRRISLGVCSKSVAKEIVESLERLSLVDFSTSAGIERLKKSIKFADIEEVETSTVEPLVSTTHNRNVNLFNGVPVNHSYRKELMKIAAESEEFYYVAPLGIFTSKKEKNHR